MTTAGYASRQYAESLSEFGRVRELPECGGWLLEREIPGLPWRDAMGPYPVFCCQNWSRLHLDLDALGEDLVAVSVLTDPLLGCDLSYLQRCFQVVVPFKQHYLADLQISREALVSRNHRYHARRASKNVKVEVCAEPEKWLDEWVGLYATLIARHNIHGLRAFSRASFQRQFRVPGLVMLRAMDGDSTVGLTLWYVQHEVAWYHLAAYNPIGYRLHASYAVFWCALGHFAALGLRWLCLGAGPGISSDDALGLKQFKRGWASETRPTYLCGQILSRKRYADIVTSKGILSTNYFPAYRAGEFQ